MGKVNSQLAAMAAVLTNPITFTAMAGDEAVGQANVQLVIDAISLEETNPTEHRLYLDEMSPTCRTSLYRILVDLKASLTGA